MANHPRSLTIAVSGITLPSYLPKDIPSKFRVKVWMIWSLCMLQLEGLSGRIWKIGSMDTVVGSKNLC